MASSTSAGTAKRIEATKTIISTAALDRWGDEYMDLQVISGVVESARPRQDYQVQRRPEFQNCFTGEGMLTILCRGYQWRVWSAIATQTSNTMNLIVTKHRRAGTSLSDMEINFDQWGIHPYIAEEIIQFWSSLSLKMTHTKHKVVERAAVYPSAAKTHDYTNSMTGLTSLIYLVDAAYALNDTCLKYVAFAALRSRLVGKLYTTKEFLDAMDEVYGRKRNKENNTILRKIFLSASIMAHLGYAFDDSEHVDMFNSQQWWSQEFGKDFNKGLAWYYAAYLSKARSF